MDEGLLPSIRAYMDWRTFGLLPNSGGIRQQRIATMRDLRIITAVIADERERLKPKR